MRSVYISLYAILILGCQDPQTALRDKNVLPVQNALCKESLTDSSKNAF
jgi:hypothetical protein